MYLIVWLAAISIFVVAQECEQNAGLTTELCGPNIAVLVGWDIRNSMDQRPNEGILTCNRMRASCGGGHSGTPYTSNFGFASLVRSQMNNNFQDTYPQCVWCIPYAALTCDASNHPWCCQENNPTYGTRRLQGEDPAKPPPVVADHLVEAEEEPRLGSRRLDPGGGGAAPPPPPPPTCVSRTWKGRFNADSCKINNEGRYAPTENECLECTYSQNGSMRGMFRKTLPWAIFRGARCTTHGAVKATLYRQGQVLEEEYYPTGGRIAFFFGGQIGHPEEHIAQAEVKKSWPGIEANDIFELKGIGDWRAQFGWDFLRAYTSAGAPLDDGQYCGECIPPNNLNGCYDIKVGDTCDNWICPPNHVKNPHLTFTCVSTNKDGRQDSFPELTKIGDHDSPPCIPNCENYEASTHVSSDSCRDIEVGKTCVPECNAPYQRKRDLTVVTCLTSSTLSEPQPCERYCESYPGIKNGGANACFGDLKSDHLCCSWRTLNDICFPECDTNSDSGEVHCVLDTTRNDGSLTWSDNTKCNAKVKCNAIPNTTGACAQPDHTEACKAHNVHGGCECALSCQTGFKPRADIVGSAPCRCLLQNGVGVWENDPDFSPCVKDPQCPKKFSASGDELCSDQFSDTQCGVLCVGEDGSTSTIDYRCVRLGEDAEWQRQSTQECPGGEEVDTVRHEHEGRVITCNHIPSECVESFLHKEYDYEDWIEYSKSSNTCAPFDDGSGTVTYWCSTSVNENGIHQTGQGLYKDCSQCIP